VWLVPASGGVEESGSMPKQGAWPNINRRSLVSRSNGRKLAEVVAEAIENEVVAKEWPVGEILGSEPELLDRFGVSRAVLREAIRIVENHRVARMRRGPRGGLVVTKPDVGSLARTAALLLDSEHVTGENLAEARVIVELAAVEDATKRLDEDGIELLKRVIEDEGRPEEAVEVIRGAHDLHAVIASLSGNPALRLFVDVLIELTTSEHSQRTFRRTARSAADRARIAAEVHQTHAGIVDAMISGDVSLAVHRMRRHLQAMQPWLERQQPL
jgi:DNA-binding FadR family transcriptional regulator